MEHTGKKWRLKEFAFPFLFGITLPQLSSVVATHSNFKYKLPIWYILAILFLIETGKYCIDKGYISIISAKKISVGITWGILGLGFCLAFMFIVNKTGVDKNSISGGRLDFFKDMNVTFPIVCLFGPIWEEVIFRGIIGNRIFDNPRLGIIISSILFALFHGVMSVYMLLFYFVMGVIFSLANQNEDDITSSIIAHIFYNTGIAIISLM